MGADAIGFTLGLITIGMSLVAIRGRHLLLSVSTAGLWGALLAYFLANSTVGNWQTMLIVSAVGFMIALFLLGVFRDIRVKSNTQEPPTVYDEEEYGGVKGMIHRLNSDEMPNKPTEPLGEGNEEYRAKVHRALGRERRRRRLY